MTQFNGINTLALGATLLLAPLAASADWPAIHRDATHNAQVAVDDGVFDLTAAPAWNTGAQNLQTAVRPVHAGSFVYGVAFTDTPSDTLTVKAFNDTDGTLAWESDPLDIGNSVAFGSASAPLVDTAAGVVYYGSGSTMHAISTVDGTLDWSTTMDGTNTDPNGEYGIINSSPSISGDGSLVYIKTFLGFGSTLSSQVVAFDTASGAVDWFAPPGGPGNISPLVVTTTAFGEIVITDAEDGSGNGGLVAFDADTGTEVWNHATITNPWNTGGRDFYADIVSAGGFVWGVTYDFGPVGDLVRVDPETGEADLFTSLGTDVPPILLGGRAYIAGGAFGDADLAAYDTATGSNQYTVDLGFTVFRNYPAANNNILYITDGAGVQSYFLVNGSSAGATPVSDSYAGPVSLTNAGGLYALESDGSISSFAPQTFTRVGDWQRYE